MKLLSKLVLLLPVTMVLVIMAQAQMRQIHTEPSDPENEVVAMSFFNASEGFVAFRKWVGYTTDSGRSYTQKAIRLDNVDFNGYPVNLTFGFYISAIKAFDKDRIVVAGDYGAVSAILTSSDGGNSFKLNFHSSFGQLSIKGGITAMIFPQGNTGYAVDLNRVLKTVDGGQTWNTVFIRSDSYFTGVEAADNQNVYAFSNGYEQPHFYKTNDGGSNWTEVILPAIPGKRILYSFFRSAAVGWLSLGDNNNHLYFYRTSDGGATWIQQNDTDATPFGSRKFHFVSDSVGFALGGLFTVFKSTDSGKIWEPLPRDNDFSYLLYGHNDLHFYNSDQFWAAGGGGLVELTKNGGGIPIPVSSFKADTTGVAASGAVMLKNYSKRNYSYRWYVNGELLGTTYNISYQHNENITQDTITLIVSNGSRSDTAVKYHHFNPPLEIISFSPSSAPAGAVVSITGNHFEDITSVNFGGVPASEFWQPSYNTIMARVGAGASGSIRVYTKTSTGSKAGFVFIPAPVIGNFSPVRAIAGNIVTINGSNFNDVTAVRFGGTSAISFTVVSPGQIKAVAPSGASGAIEVVTPGGTISMPGYFAIPTISSFTPEKGTHGTVMTITGTSLSDIDKVTIGRIMVDSIISKTSNQIIAIVGPGKSGDVIAFKKSDSVSRPGFKWVAAPVINAFSPVSGSIGTTVTINGKNFSSVPDDNYVRFGDVHAKVISASTTALTVKVPAGASFEPLSVVTNSLTGFSDKPFSVTWSGGGSITDSSFKDTVWVRTGTNFNNNDIAGSDLDGDGFTDLILSRYNRDGIPYSGIAILRNISGPDNISFDTVQVIFGNYVQLKTADINNDGKQDILVTGEGTLSIYLNESLPGKIQLSAPIVLQSVPDNFEVSDIDYDGKIDLLYVGGYYSDLQMYRNISEPGSVAFETKTDVLGQALGAFRIVDLNADGKSELVTGGKVFRNTSTIGKISFQHAADWNPLQFPPYGIGDIDKDGKPEIISYSISSSLVAVFKNISSANSFGFAEAIILPGTEMPRSVTFNDMDGDGRGDIIVTLYNNSIGVYKNTSTAGSLSFSPKVDYIASIFNGTRSQNIADLNNDGKYEVITFSELMEGLTIHLNKVKAEPVVLSFTPEIAISGSTITISGENFVDVKSVMFGEFPASSFTVISPTQIKAILSGGATGDVKVTNAYGSGKLSGFNYGIPPVITGMSEVSAEVGSVITIYGNNFAANTNDNLVFFGNVAAVIVSSTKNSIQVRVPASPANEQIRVISHGLTALSPVFFSVKFTGADNNITSASFEPKKEIGNSGAGIMADLDGDSRPEMITVGDKNDIKIAKNLSEPGKIIFEQDVRINVGDGIVWKGIATGDIDGDGKLDVVTSHVGGSLIKVFRNTSTTGHFGLQEEWKYNSGYSYAAPPMVIVDVDLDGRPDIVTISYPQRMVSVFRNESAEGKIKMGERIGYYLNDDYPNDVRIADVNNDGKPEIILAAGGITIMNNKSTPGKIRYEFHTQLTGGNWPLAVDISDLDGDGKTDLALLNANSNDVYLYRNIGSGNEIAFTPGPVLQTSGGSYDIRIGDLDGDGFREVVVQTSDNNYINIYKNKSKTGELSFLPGTKAAQANGVNEVYIEDVDVDGLPDIVSFSGYYWSSVLRNQTGLAAPVRYCNNGDLTLEATIAGTVYQWQKLNNGVFENITNSDTYAGVEQKVLHLKSIPATWHGALYRCVTDGNNGYPFRLDSMGTMKLPSVSLIYASDSAICAGTSVSFMANYSNIGADPQLEWLVNEVPTGVNTTEFSSATLKDSSEVKVRLVTSGVCLAQDTVYSVPKKISVADLKLPTVAVISPSDLLCRETRVDFSAQYTNGGNSPMFEWRKNGVVMGPFEPVFTEFNLEDGDMIVVSMQSNEKCVTNKTVTSLPLRVSVMEKVNPAVTIVAGSVSMELGQVTRLNADVSHGGSSPVIQWQDSTKYHGWQTINSNGDLQIDYMPATTGDKVRCLMTSNAVCASASNAYSNALVFEVKNPARRVQVVPNPVMTTLTLVVELKDKWQSLEITDMQGRIEQSYTNVENRTKIEVDVSRLQTGIYLAILRNSNGDMERVRFMKN